MSEPDVQAEAVKFLERDFSECFAEKRRCEDMSWDICKFAFAVHSGIVALAVAAFQFSMEKGFDLVPAAEVALGMGFATGLFLLLLLARTRIYFVVVTRYINEHRRFFLGRQPLGFTNISGFYSDPSQPPFLSWSSTQTWAMGLVAALNAAVAAALVFLLSIFPAHRAWGAVVTFVAITALQLLFVADRLGSLEGKSTTEAVFGRSQKQ